MINGCKIGCCLSTLYSLFTLYKLVDEYVDSAICLLIIGLIIIIIIIRVITITAILNYICIYRAPGPIVAQLLCS